MLLLSFPPHAKLYDCLFTSTFSLYKYLSLICYIQGFLFLLSIITKHPFLLYSQFKGPILVLRCFWSLIARIKTGENPILSFFSRCFKEDIFFPILQFILYLYHCVNTGAPTIIYTKKKNSNLYHYHYINFVWSFIQNIHQPNKNARRIAEIKASHKMVMLFILFNKNW